MAEIVHVATIDRSRHMGPGQSVPNLCRAEVSLGRTALVMNALEGAVYDPAVGDEWRPVEPDEWERRIREATVVHFNGVFHPRYIRLAGHCRRHRVPYVVCPRGNLVWRAMHTNGRARKSLAYRLWVSRFLRRSAAVHFLTPAEAAASQRAGAPIMVAPNGVAEHADGAPPGSRPRRILFIGRIDIAHKGLDRLLEFAGLWRHSLVEDGWEVHLHGPDHRGGRDWVSARIQSEGLGSFVRLLEPVSGARKTEALRAARLFVHPSRFEGQPQAVLEAMAAGCPVAVSVGTNLQAEVLEAGCGFAWEPLVVNGEDALRSLTSDERVRRLGEAGRRVVARDYTWAAAARVTLKELDRIVG